MVKNFFFQQVAVNVNRAALNRKLSIKVFPESTEMYLVSESHVKISWRKIKLRVELSPQSKKLFVIRLILTRDPQTIVRKSLLTLDSSVAEACWISDKKMSSLQRSVIWF